MSTSNYRVLQGFSTDAHIYRYGNKILQLHRQHHPGSSFTKFYQLSGRQPSDAYWMIVLDGNSGQIVGVCTLCSHDECHLEMFNLLLIGNQDDVCKCLIRNIRKYARFMSIFTFEIQKKDLLLRHGARTASIKNQTALLFPANKHVTGG